MLDPKYGVDKNFFIIRDRKYNFGNLKYKQTQELFIGNLSKAELAREGFFPVWNGIYHKHPHIQ